MYAAGQRRAKCLVNRAMTFDPGHPAKGLRAKDDMKMAFTALEPTGMSTVFLAFVDHLQQVRRKICPKFLFYLGSNQHFLTMPSSKPCQKP